MSVKLSVVMAAFNASNTVEAALASIQQQQFSHDYEIIVVNDASTDMTGEVLHQASDSRVNVISLRENVGRAAARNLAIAEASGSVIVVADADDWSLPARLQTHWDILESAPNAVVSGGQLRDLIGGVVLSRSNLRFPATADGVDRKFLKGEMGIAHPASAFRKEWFDELGGYDPSLDWCEDYDLFARGWEPGLFLPTPDVLISYARRTAVTDWAYWWENNRHLAAVNSRLQAAPERQAAITLPISGHLARASCLGMEIYEKARFEAYRGKVAIRSVYHSLHRNSEDD
jgi:glycosyltransferase involved in cell wall biosynthesis